MGNVAVRLKALRREKANQLDADIEALEIIPDHVHLFVGHVSEETVRKHIETQEQRS